ncbi:MAG: DUF1353 domain-containing protein [Gammaproteobacteria bacterium]|nr:DUF1353 domain-containing protein [Gammaproteobacteria bacterium]
MLNKSPVQLWMSALAQREDASVDLRLMPFEEPVWTLTHPSEWTPEPGLRNPPRSVSIPFGFVTSMFSVSKLYWKWLPSERAYAQLAIAHDYLYWMQDGDRGRADRLLYLGLKAMHVPLFKALSIYVMTRIHGRVIWYHYGEDRKEGGQRVLKVLPQRPPTSWLKWKQGNVF